MNERHRVGRARTSRRLAEFEFLAEAVRLVGSALLETAAKYAPPEGKIDIYGWRADGRVYLAITIDGPGIPVDWRERIFEPRGSQFVLELPAAR